MSFLTELKKIDYINIEETDKEINVKIEILSKPVIIFKENIGVYQFVPGPNSIICLHFMYHINKENLQIIICPNDIVFEPKDDWTGYDFIDIPFQIENMPTMISYSDTLKTLDNLSNILETEKNIDTIFATIVMTQYFLNGAKKIGVDVSKEEIKLKEIRELSMKL